MLGITIVNNELLYLGIGIELLLLVAIGLVVWAMVRSGIGRKKTTHLKRKNRYSLFYLSYLSF